ncbi:MAG TPA: response regulator [Chryseolinea sp.]|nr:response regulator [Chryseolinea sp.]
MKTSVRKIMLVEDDPDDRDLFLFFYAKRNDLRLLPVFENGVELIDHLNSISSNDELPDLIVLDQNMPKMNGKQTLQFLKSHERFSKIPAVIYSTYTDSTLIVECTELGANMVAVKPIDDDGYQKMMNDFLQVFNV